MHGGRDLRLLSLRPRLLGIPYAAPAAGWSRLAGSPMKVPQDWADARRSWLIRGSPIPKCLAAALVW